MHMRVYWKSRHVEREQQDDSRGFRSNTINCSEPCFRIGNGHLAQQVEAIRASMVVDDRQGFLNTRGFALGEASRTDGLSHCADRCIAHLIPSGELRD